MLRRFEMQVTIIGAGAMGGVTGAFLARAGEAVTLVDVVEEHVRAIQKDGLRMDGLEEFTVPVRAITPDRLEGPLQMVIIAVKTQHTQEAIGKVLPYLDRDSYVVPLQNGISAVWIGEQVGEDRVLPTSIATHQFYMGPGHIRYLNRGEVHVGEWDGRITPRVEEVVRLLSYAYEAHATENIWGWIWGKTISGSIVFTTALVDSTMGPAISKSRRHQRMFVRIAGEAAAIAKAKGIRIEPVSGIDPDLLPPRTEAELEAAVEMMSSYADLWWDVHSGVWRDIAVRKRRTEGQTLIAPLIKEGEAAGLDMSLHRAMKQILNEIENGSRPQAWRNLDELIEISERR
jgi:2-dehydropantoate 2-reductase